MRDSFWTDPYIEKLSPDYKLVFLYLLTNPLANIAGVYEVRLKRVAYETGYDVEVVDTILKKFSDDKKIIMLGDWIVIVNHIKHQSLGNLTAEGINRIIKESPNEVQSLFEEKTLTNSKGDEYKVMCLIDTPYIPLIYPLQAPTNGAYSEVKLSRVTYNTYGEFQNVKLKGEEYAKLIEKIGENTTKSLIEDLSIYMSYKNKRYSNHYATILNWAKRKKETKNNKSKNITTI